MAPSIVDIHPHIISTDDVRYPPSPLFGKRSGWSQERPCPVETLIAAMDDADIDKAVVVHSSTTYGFDNSYVVDSCRRYANRLVAVGSVDVLAEDACDTIREWVYKGLGGLRIFTGGSTKDFDPSELGDARSFPVWELLSELQIPMCIQTGPIGLPQVAILAERFPNVNIILDHLARPDVLDGPPYANAASLWRLAEIPNIFLKLTPRIFSDSTKESATPETFFPKVVNEFGADRLAWGSNFPNSPGSLSEIRATAEARLACLSSADRSKIFSATAMRLYPSLTASAESVAQQS